MYLCVITGILPKLTCTHQEIEANRATTTRGGGGGAGGEIELIFYIHL